MATYEVQIWGKTCKDPIIKKYKQGSAATKLYRKYRDIAQQSWDCGAKYYKEVRLISIRTEGCLVSIKSNIHIWRDGMDLVVHH